MGKPGLRVIAHKRISLTEDEYNLYQKIAKSYDKPNFKGSSLFVELFETDDKGIIRFIYPPSKQFTSMEVFLFIQNVYVNQHLRLMYDEIDEYKKKIKEELKKEILEELKK